MSDSGEPQEPRRERLEVPSSSGLERRLLVGDAAPRRPRSKPPIAAVPQSGLLGRLQTFLPTLAAANDNLQQQLDSGEVEQVAMEHGSEEEREGPYVEMDLACGLFDLKDEAAVAAAEAAIRSGGVAVEAYGGSSDSSSEDDSDSDSDSEAHGGGGANSEGVAEAAAGVRQAPVAAAAAPQQQRGGGLVATNAAEAMEEDGGRLAEGGGAPTTATLPAAAAAARGASLPGQPGAAAAAPGRRRSGGGKQRRHAGIVELS